MLRFEDLISTDERPNGAGSVDRGTIATDTRSTMLGDDLANNGFVSNLFNRRRANVARATRRNFLRGSVAAAGAGVAVASSRFGPAKEVEAQGTVVGSFPYRIYTACPSWAAGHDCNPGCGSTPVCTDCCDANGFFIENQAAGFRVHPGQCATAGGNVDGWLWAYGAPCGACQSIEYRCHDGYKLLPTGASFVWFPHICRAVTSCGQAPVAPVASPTPTTVPFNPAPAPAPSAGVSYVSSLASAVDNGNGSATLTGWVKANTTASIGYMISVDGVPMHTGTANQPYFTGFPGAGPNHGFTAVVNGLTQGTHEFCVHGTVNGIQTRLICTNLFISVSAGANPPPATVPTPLPTTPPVATSTPIPAAPAPVAVNPGVVPQFYGAIGSLDVLRRANDGNAFVSGWAARSASAGTGPINVVISVDGVDKTRVSASLPRQDITGSFQQAYGFSGRAQLRANRTSNVCVMLEDPSTGARFQIGCRSVTGGASPASLPPLSGGGSAPAPQPTATSAPVSVPPTTTPVPTSAPIQVPPTATAVPASSGPPASGGGTSIPGYINTARGEVRTMAAPLPGMLLVGGWLYYPQDEPRAAAYEIFVDGISQGVSYANQPDPIAAANLGIGANHGFTRFLSVTPGSTVRVEVYPVTGAGRGNLIANVFMQV